MRERTPSADDTPKRAPPAPPREAASADVLVDGRSARVAANDSARTSSGLSSSTEKRIITMVTSEQGLEKLGSSQPTINDRSQQQQRQQQQQSYNYRINQHSNNNNHNNNPERQGITGYRSAQTAQDKRSRLSNVINNLRKKVPSDNTTSTTTATTAITITTTGINDLYRTKDTSVSSRVNNRQEDESRNSVERNLANLEKYVMTVLSGVIKDAESKEEIKKDVEREKSSKCESLNETIETIDTKVEKCVKKDKDIDNRQTYSPEPSKPNESRMEAAIPGSKKIESTERTFDEKKVDRSDGIRDREDNNEAAENLHELSDDSNFCKKSCDVDSKESREERQIEKLSKLEESRLENSSNSVTDSVDFVSSANKEGVIKCSLSNDDEQNNIPEDAATSSISEDKRNNRSLGTLILDRLDHQILINDDSPSETPPEQKDAKIEETENNKELRTICRDLLNELLNDISQLIEKKPVENDEKSLMHAVKIDDSDEARMIVESSNTSIQCSLPLEKVGPILQNCQNSSEGISSSTPSPQQTSKSPTKSVSPTIRHLCLYCDRKFLSISLRQRHTERVHQLGGSRRSERNSRKTTQNCQYCAEKCADNLDSLFQHMIVNHTDEYHACIQCTTRYLTKDTLVNHMSDIHGCGSEKNLEICDRTNKESSSVKESSISSTRENGSQCSREKQDVVVTNDRRVEDEQEKNENEAVTGTLIFKNTIKSQSVVKDVISNPGSPEFDSTFYSSVSCNIRENLLHHLDGKLQVCTNPPGGVTNDVKSFQASPPPPPPPSPLPAPLPSQQQQQQSFYDHSANNQVQFPIDISLTAATPVYSKEYPNDEYENSSEYAQKPGKTGRSHPRRVSFEKYNFPRKYDGKEQWTSSIKDLSKFDISTQLTLRKKQQIIKERLTSGRFQNGAIPSGSTDIFKPEVENLPIDADKIEQNIERVEDSRTRVIERSVSASVKCSTNLSEAADDTVTDHLGSNQKAPNNPTEFTVEFGNFIRLRKWKECNTETKNDQEVVYAELTGEWSRPRVYICGACTSKHLTLRELEDHKTISHPNVWCSHLEFTGDQRELYKHLFLPGRSVATSKAKNAVLSEKVCTKCSKICGSLAELHRHMLECGGDQAWLLGLFGNGKKKCKWRPFGSRSRRRRQRGMKRNIQNSQTARVNQPRERNSTGPRVRPSDRESIQKMLANLPPKRSSRRVLQDTTVRSQGRLRKMQTRSKPRMVDQTIPTCRLSQKAVLRNKLLKNAKSFQRKRCRGDNITAAIENVVKKSEPNEKPNEKNGNDDEEEEEEEKEAEEEEDEEEEEEEEDDEEEEEEDEVEDDSGLFKESRKFETPKIQGEKSKVRRNLESSNRSTKIVRGVRVVSKKRNVKSKNLHNVVVTKSRVMNNRRNSINNSIIQDKKNAKNSPTNNDKKESSIDKTENTNDGKLLSSNSSSPSHSAILRRKKHVDPVVSLHASLKARSQLRTHDGKFARKVDTITRSQRRNNETVGVSTRRKNSIDSRRSNAENNASGKQKSANKSNPELDESSSRSSNSEKRDNASTNKETTKKNLSDGKKPSWMYLLSLRGSNNATAKRGPKKVNTEPENDGKMTEEQRSNKVTRKSLTKKNISDTEKRDEPTEEKMGNAEEKSATKNNVEAPSNVVGKSKKSTNSKKNSTNQQTNSVELDLDEVITKNVIDVTRIKNSVQTLDRDQRSTRGRRSKNIEGGISSKNMETSTSSTDSMNNDVKIKNRSSSVQNEEFSKRACSKESKNREIKEYEDSVKKSDKIESHNSTKKIETLKTIGTRRTRRTGSSEDFSKIQDAPNDAKKNLESSEDPPMKIEPKNNDKIKKTRQLQKSKINNSPRNKGQKKNSANEKEDVSMEMEKCALRISPRTLDKKESKNVDKKMKEKSTTEKDREDTKVEESVDDVSTRETGDSEKIKNNVGKRKGRIKTRVDNENIDGTSVECEKDEEKKFLAKESVKNSSKPIETNDERNTEEMIEIVVNAENAEEPIKISVKENLKEQVGKTNDTENPEEPIETIIDDNPKRLITETGNTDPVESIEKIGIDNSEDSIETTVKKSSDESIVSKHLDESIEMAIKRNLDPLEKKMEENGEESIPTIVGKNPEISSEIITDQNSNDSTEPIVDSNLKDSVKIDYSNCEESIDNSDKKMKESSEVVEKNIDDKILDCSKPEVPRDIATLNFEHLQQESNNSNIDSGKENSSETPVNVSKLKVVRPKKSRGSRRERIGKRSLSNVIGILTEGVNIPVEIQQSVVLTVQTSIETTSENGNQSNSGQVTGSNAASGESSNIHESVKPSEISDAACSSTTTSEEFQTSVKVEKAEMENTVNVEKMEKSHENTSDNSETSIKQPEVQRHDETKVSTTQSLPAINNKGSVQSTANEPTNDIILDLSRRKPKGKGSFLEKIVSKIAKKKDALLEGDVGCLLDNAADELTNILSEINPPIVERTTDTSKINTSNEEKGNDKVCQNKPSKDEKIIVPTEVIVSDVISDVMKDTKNRIDVQIESSEPPISESSTIPTFVDRSLILPPEVESSTIDESEASRNSKKRSFDSSEEKAKTNKRKTMVDEQVEKNNSSEDEMCLADIMELINENKQNTPNVEEKNEIKNNAKRKIAEINNSSTTNDKIPIIDDIQDQLKSESNVTEIKKSKRNSLKKSQLSSESDREKIVEDKNIEDPALTIEVSGSKMSEIKSNETSSNSIAETNSKVDEKFEEVSQVSTKICNVRTIVPEKLKPRPPRKCAAKKKSLIDEHLNLSEDEDFNDIVPRTLEKIGNSPVSQMSESSKPAVSVETVESKKTIDSIESPDVNELASSSKRITRKQPLFFDNLPSTIDATILSKNIIAATSQEFLSNRSEAESQRTNNDEENKSQDAIVTAEEKCLIDSTSLKNGMKSIGTCDSIGIDEAEIEKSSEKINSIENEKDTSEEIQTDTSMEDDVESDGSIEKRRSLTRKAKEVGLNDESTPFSDAKLQRKFAVVHTKSGKMLIVEKKKKFTKEAAKFFCEICAASFTRKSSLKKHNSSQSHLLQVTKYCEEADKIDSTDETSSLTLEKLENETNAISNDISEDSCEKNIDKIENNEKEDETILKELQKSREQNLPDKNKTEEKQECDNRFSLEKENDDAVTFGGKFENSITLTNQTSIFEEKKLIVDDLEDELLDEEICKITENMTHDEYVLTDHVSPVIPEASSTPVVSSSIQVPDTPDSIKKISDTQIDEKTRDRESKMNLADEHLNLDSPVVDDIFSEAAISNVFENRLNNSVTSKLGIKLTIAEKPVHEDSEPSDVSLNATPLNKEDPSIDKSTRSRKKRKKSVAKMDAIVPEENELLVPEMKSNDDCLSSQKKVLSGITMEEKSNPEIEESVIDLNKSRNSLEKSTKDFPLKEDLILPVKIKSPIVLDFSNITEKLNVHSENTSKNISCGIEFDSDEDTLDTNMSDDIRKILDDPELDTDNKQIDTEQEFCKNVEDRPANFEIAGTNRNKEKSNIEESTSNKKEKTTKKSSRGKTGAKEIGKKSKTTRSRRSANSSKTKLDETIDTSDSEYDEMKKDVTDSKNKSKIVKSVFGRVFGGEKIDKVKEVLEDWVSRSEGDSYDDTRTSADFSKEKNETIVSSPISSDSKKSRKEEKKSIETISHDSSHSIARSPERGRGKKRGRSKNSDVTSGSESPEKNNINEDGKSKSKSKTSGRRRKNSDKKSTRDSSSSQISSELVTNSRCRQSKKRAEERISRAFEDESSIVYEDIDLLNQIGASIAMKNSRIIEEEQQQDSKAASSKKVPTNTSKKNSQDTTAGNDSEESETEKIRRKIVTNETSRSKKGRSRSVEISSEKNEAIEDAATVLSEIVKVNENEDEEEEEEEEDEDEIALGRMSPLYIYNTPESSIESSSNSEDEERNDKKDDDRCVDESVKEKIVVSRSPVSIATNREEGSETMIGINDEIEDNALDVSRDHHPDSANEKSRQGKVLNFDEELFVECCSRLKATTENELRGAKKIKLDHNDIYDKNDQQTFRSSRDRWRDVESQNSLGSLLESVNQLLGEEMYSGNRTNDYAKRGRNNSSEKSSRSASPEVDTNRQENLGYEDSLDVAFEHNNKLRVKIQQRMRESENLIANTFGQKTSVTNMQQHNHHRRHHHHHNHHHHHHHRAQNHQRHHDNSHNHRRENRQMEHGRKENTNIDRSMISNENLHANENYDDRINEKTIIDHSNKDDDELDCSSFRNKNTALGGLIDNLLHSNGKHDHNGSTPMNVLAELACARVPTSTLPESNPSLHEKFVKSPSRIRDSSSEDRPLTSKELMPKKPRNPIRELFERKKEINERKHHEKIVTEVSSKEFNIQKAKKSKKPKKQQQQQHQQDFPLIRKSQLGGMVERKKRREEKKIISSHFVQERIKDVYDFDDDDSQQETNSVMSYRNKNEKSQEITNTIKTTEIDMSDIMTKTIDETLKNGKTGNVLGRKLESMIDRKFQEIETFPPKTKGALKSFQIEEKQQNQQARKDEPFKEKIGIEEEEEDEEEEDAEKDEKRRITGPMDDFVERKKSSKKMIETPMNKHGRSKRKSKNSKKKSRNAWYENDSSDEFVTAAKAEDVGVGTTKSQRTCSKGKQNLFAESSTSSESEYENFEDNYESKRNVSRIEKEANEEEIPNDLKIDQLNSIISNNYPETKDEDEVDVDWINVATKRSVKSDFEHKKSESEMSDHPLIIDERKTETDETRNSDDDMEARYVPTFELDDLYREDTTDETDEDTNDRENDKNIEDPKTRETDEILQRKEEEDCYNDDKELIPLEEALDLLDNNEDLSKITDKAKSISRTEAINMEKEEEPEKITKENKKMDEKEIIENDIDNDCDVSNNDEIDEESELPEKLSSNVKPCKESDNLPLHVFLSRKVQESKKRKQQQAKKLQEEQERILLDFQPTRRQRKCAIGKQGLLAEISSSDDECYTRETCKRSTLTGEKMDEDRQTRKPKRESKEKRKERYIEKKHEQIIAKEQKAIEEEILRELEKTKGSSVKSDTESTKSMKNTIKDDSIVVDKYKPEDTRLSKSPSKKKRQQKSRKSATLENPKNNENKEKLEKIEKEGPNKCKTETRSNSDENQDTNEQALSSKPKRKSKSAQKSKKSLKISEMKSSNVGRKSKISNGDKIKSKIVSTPNKDSKERRTSCGKRDSDDEELRTTKCWNKVDEGVGVAIGRRKRAAANQLYYWSSSSDDDEPVPPPTPIVEEEDDRQEQHGWIVGDSHKRMITMLAMEKQLKEKRRRSEDEFEPGKTKNKKHRNSTS